MPLSATLNIRNKSYDLLRCNYRFTRKIDSKGVPMGGMQGGNIIVEFESTEDTLLLEQFLGQAPQKISGSIEIHDQEEMTVVRTIAWEEAYVYAASEVMDGNSALPMTQTFEITPLRMDFNRAVRIDRRFPQTNAFWWEEYVPEKMTMVSVVDEEEPEPEIIKVLWKDADGQQEISELPEDMIVSLYAQVKNGVDDQEVTFNMELENGEKIEIKGTVSKGIVVVKGIDLKQYYEEAKEE